MIMRLKKDEQFWFYLKICIICLFGRFPFSRIEANTRRDLILIEVETQMKHSEID